MSKGLVYLVGGGPGDPKLITVKGLEAIRKANVIIYDRLAGRRLLAYARPEAELIYAGKSPDRHTLKQEEINRLIVEKALENKIVTRLKGGDPFLFGRGGEEAVALSEAGIPFEIVPGVTSAIAVPAYAGIPVTHRGCASTLSIITGNEDPEKEDSGIAWDKLAALEGTLVFLMGMTNLPKITGRLLEYGKTEETPVALVRWGATPQQQTLVGTLGDISAKALQASFKNPAVIVVGEVVSMREKLNWFERKPFYGKKVLVTRAREQASRLSEIIYALGGEPVEYPTILVAEPDDYAKMDIAIHEIESFDWIIFTSVNGVASFFKRLRHHRLDVRRMHQARLCAIGPKTREALENYGLLVESVPGEYRAEEIVRELQSKVLSGDRVLLPRAEIARRVLPDALTAMGAVVTEVPAYRTLTGGGDTNLVKTMLQNKDIQVITFTSSSTVQNFVKMLDDQDLSPLLEGILVACIGPVTADTARDLGVEVDVVADEYTIEGLVKSIVDYFSSVSA